VCANWNASRFSSSDATAEDELLGFLSSRPQMCYLSTLRPKALWAATIIGHARYDHNMSCDGGM